MTSAATIAALADELAEVLLRGDPFGASFMAISGYDDAVPDLSPEYQRAWRGRITDIIARCADGEADPGDTSSRVLLETVRDTAARELAAADSRVYEFSVTTFPLGGPSLVLLIASRTRVNNPESAAAYLTRCRRIPLYLDQHAARLRTAAHDGLVPSPRWSATPSGSSTIICRTRNGTQCSPAGHPKAGPGRGGVAGGGRARHPGRGSGRPSAATLTCSPSCCPGPAATSRPCSTCRAEYPPTRRASGTARRFRSTPTSSTASA